MSERKSVLRHDTPVAERRRSVSGYLYAYVRLLELATSWTMHVPTMPLKIALGRNIGLAGLALERLSRRITQMFASTSKGTAPATYAQWIDRQHDRFDDAHIAAVVTAILTDLQRSMNRYIERAHHGDEPTVLMLKTLSSELTAGLESMKPFLTTSIELPDIDAQGPRVDYTGTEPLLAAPELPARPPNFTQDPTAADGPKLSLRDAMQPANIALMFRRFYIDVEIAAIEVCSRNVVEYRDMPIAFKVDMSQQIWDEARHAELAISVMRHYGEELGDVRYTGLVWTRHKSGDSLAERLAIEQIIQEGNSVDRAYVMIEMVRSFKLHAAAEALEWLTADETQHALIGNRWLMRLCDNSREKYEEIVRRAQEKIRFPLSPVNRELREISGFPVWYVDALEREFNAMTAAAAPKT